jgi:nucleotidyltransferase AbiEii toxin of type IV toxin-antitoxin system
MNHQPLHGTSDFGDLIRVVAAKRNLTPGMVEKDYWVVESLKAIQNLGWQIYFKGGTSLSKGFGIIKRFSEDLDLKIEPIGDWCLPENHNWKGQGKQSVRDRELHFTRMEREMRIHNCRIHQEARDSRWRSISLRVEYPMAVENPLAPMSEGVLLEIGCAKVHPWQLKPISSWAADFARGQNHPLGGSDLDPVEVRCLLPEVTLLEKIDAICRRYSGSRDAAAFVRHYEDAAAIVIFLNGSKDASLNAVSRLYEEMVDAADIQRLSPKSPGLQLADPIRNKELEIAWRAAEELHWGQRIPLTKCAAIVSQFMREASIGA